jgi:heme oxygenase
MTSKVQARLRVATHSSHVRINQHPLLTGLTARDYPMSRYRTVLAAYYHLYAALEQRIAQFTQHHPDLFDYSLRWKQPWLQADLTYLKIDPLLASNRPRRPLLVPPIDTIGAFIGLLYPLEGATLGGQVISQQLKTHLGLSADQGSRFFSGFGADTMARWQDYCQFADSIQDNTLACQMAETTAVLIFNAFEEVLNDYQ